MSLFDGSVVMPADLLVDSGAECELKLPGRKVLQLGLQQTGVPVHTKGSIPGHAEEVTGRNCFHTPASGSPPWLGNESSPTTPAAGPHPPNIEIIKLSPVRHRPKGREDEQALLGFAALQKLRMHINAEKQQLEIEEETYIEA